MRPITCAPSRWPVPAPGIIFSLFSLVRITLSASSQAHYLLDPDLDTRERVCRVMNLVLTSHNEQLRLIKAPSVVPNAAEVAKVEAWIQDLLTTAKLRGFPITMQDKGRSHLPHHFGTVIPSETDLVNALLGGSNNSDYGIFAYRLCSAAVHNQPHIDSILPLHTTGSSREGMTDARRRITMPTLAAIVSAAASGYVEANNRAMIYFGVDSRDETMAKATAILNDLAGPALQASA